MELSQRVRQLESNSEEDETASFRQFKGREKRKITAWRGNEEVLL